MVSWLVGWFFQKTFLIIHHNSNKIIHDWKLFAIPDLVKTPYFIDEDSDSQSQFAHGHIEQVIG